MIYKDPRDQAVDDAAIKALTDAYGERVTSLPPVAIVIAAYNEAGAIGPVIEALPAEVCGLATATIVVADGCADLREDRRRLAATEEEHADRHEDHDGTDDRRDLALAFTHGRTLVAAIAAIER